jgi:DNA-binding MarR family transcriptional regulator
MIRDGTPYVIVANEADVHVTTVYNYRDRMVDEGEYVPRPEEIKRDYTSRQLSVMAFMSQFRRRHSKYPRVKDIREFTATTSSAVSSMMRRLESEGYVVRVDKRWELSPKGASLVALDYFGGDLLDGQSG